MFDISNIDCKVKPLISYYKNNFHKTLQSLMGVVVVGQWSRVTSSAGASSLIWIIEGHG